MFEDEDFDLDEDCFTVNFPIDPNRTNNNAISTVNTKNNSNEIVKNKSPKIVLKRKFPGPAGLFPEVTQINNSSAGFSESNSLISSTQLLSSQNPSLTFQEPAWLEMYKDFNVHRSSLIDKYNIEWIKSNAPDNLVDKKVPFLMGIIKEVKNTSKSPIFLLADLSGEIEALISMDLYEEYDEYLCVDSAIVLKRFSILTVGYSKHYINITTDNLIRIYSCKDSMEDDVKTVHIQEISNRDLEKEIDGFVSANKLSKNVVSRGVGIINEFNKASHFSNKFDGFHKGNESKTQGAVSTCQNSKFLIEKQSVEVSDKNSSYPTNNRSSTNRFYFKKHLSDGKISNTDKASHSICSKSIFDQSGNSVDLDLNVDDFQDELFMPQKKDKCRLISSEGRNERDVNKVGDSIEILGIKKRKFDEFNGHEANRNSFGSETKIDFSQISIISQNKEDPDVLKDVFSDLDASALFDDF